MQIHSIHVGRAVPFGPAGRLSAIDKQPVSGPVRITLTGVEGDEQADRKHHGDTDMAVHHYPLEHYGAWQQDLPEQAHRFDAPGRFGENLCSTGMTENGVCIGDVFNIGEAVLQVSQGRQPCWKLIVQFQVEDMAARVQETGRTGWYYHVIQPGRISQGDAFELIERPNPLWPLNRVHHHLFVDCLNKDALAALVELDGLSARWRRLFQRRLTSGIVEQWEHRVTVPDS
jgi:MOSC domain-containing protein YiiM